MFTDKDLYEYDPDERMRERDEERAAMRRRAESEERRAMDEPRMIVAGLDAKLKAATDAEWRKYFEDKCRAQRKELADAVTEITRLRELVRRSLGFVAMRLDGQAEIDVHDMQTLERDLREVL